MAISVFLHLSNLCFSDSRSDKGFHQRKYVWCSRSKLKKLAIVGTLMAIVVYMTQTLSLYEIIMPSSATSRSNSKPNVHGIIKLHSVGDEMKADISNTDIDLDESTSTVSVSSLPTASGAKELHSKATDVILNTDLELIIKYKGEEVITGNLNWNGITEVKLVDCSDFSVAGICYEWPGEKRFTISLNRSGSEDMDCFDLEWTALRCVDQVLTDCFDIRSTHWFGGYQNKQQHWPLNKNNMTMAAFVSHDIFLHPVGDVLERYFFSSKGTGIYIDSEIPFYFSMNDKEGMLCFSAKYEDFTYNNYDNRYPVLKYKICQSDNVRNIHTKMSAMFIPKPTDIPDIKLFQYPIWSTWAEFRKDINQSAVLKFASDILSYKFSHSQLEIDDFWTPTYGDFEFDIQKFPNAIAMIRKLNEMGFRVTVWVHPFFNLNSKSFSEGFLNSYFIRSYNSVRPALTKWWDGNVTAILDPTNPEAVSWYLDKLENLKKVYNISSFKFDAGEAGFLPPVFSSFVKKMDRNEIYPKSYVEMAVQSDKSRHMEVRAGYHTQKHPVFIRIMDKYSQWGHDNGIKSVIPVVLTFGILGYPFLLPDMIAGNLKSMNDSELYVRWLELNAFLPSMQYSIVPWRFNKTVVSIAQKFTSLHEKYSPIFIKLAHESTVSGYPIIRPVWWNDPYSEDALTCEDEFLVGDEILVAPVVEKGAKARDIYLPPGAWNDQLRNVKIQGETWLRNYRVELDELAYFTLSS